MRRQNLIVIAIILVCLLIIAFLGIELYVGEPPAKPPNVLVGVDVGYGDESDVYNIANAVQGYANLIIIGSLNVTSDTATLTRVCNYLYQRGFSFIIYVGYGPTMPDGPDSKFFNTTVKQWGSRFLGAYIFDEPGGKQLDYAPSTPDYIDKPIKQAANYSDAAQQYINDLYNFAINYACPTYYQTPNLEVFTSDYGLYWFDYAAGYNTILTEFVGNSSRQIAISLCRGAAHVQDKDWGVIITYGTDFSQSPPQVPAIENASQLYSDMVLAWQNDAKYIAVFDSPGPNGTATSPYGILTKPQLDAMKAFWNYASSNPRVDQDPAQVAYVLPADYGYGFGGNSDSIWGLFPADSLASRIWNDTNNLIAQYKGNIDIVYENLTGNLQTRLMYQELIYWNGTVIGHINP